jgi:hypothetical protein
MPAQVWPALQIICVMALKHKHHIVPQHRGGTNDVSNIVEISITQHAMWHYAEWQLYGSEWDRIAWKGLSGIASSSETVRAVQVESGRNVRRNQLGIFSPDYDKGKGGRVGGKIAGKKIHEERDENGKSLHGLRCAEILHSNKTEDGRSIRAIDGMNKLHAQKNLEGKSVHTMRCLEKIHSQKDENGKSLHSQKIARNTNGQKWMCLTTGFISNPGSLSRYQQKRGLSTL